MNTSHNKYLIVDYGWRNTLRNAAGLICQNKENSGKNLPHIVPETSRHYTRKWNKTKFREKVVKTATPD